MQQSKFLETVLESLAHPFYVIDARDYTVQMANSAAHKGRVAGTVTCYALTHRANQPCGSEEHPCPLEIIKRTRKPVTVEHIHYDKDGIPRNVEVHGFPIFDSEGNVTQIIEYCLDICARSKAGEPIHDSIGKLNEELEQRVVERTAEYWDKNWPLNHCRKPAILQG